ncbi:hypothetical protein VNI00_015696 [Paramarasmius palmivorus]|uniref:F-box domain-containing protein n=1 Tax=Paramarasmius palmivorus TaxID=297713 RepID=A0AAW0BJH7_9AGAR
MLSGSDNPVQNNQASVLFCPSCKTNILPTCSFPSVPLATLRSNHTPSSANIARATVILQEEERELQSYGEEIQHVRQALERLEVERRMLKRRVEERRSWLAPIRRLPMEILSKIFELSDCSLDISKYDVNTTALVLSQVSYYWRSVTIMKRSIWSNIHFEIHKMTKDLTPLLQTYIDNAAAHPLSIFISDFYDLIIPHPALHKLHKCIGMRSFHFLRALISHFPQSQVLELHSVPNEVLSYTIREETAFPLLRFLYYYGRPGIVPEQGNHFWNAVCHAPALRNVEVDDVAHWVHERFHPVSVPWNQLKTLVIGDVESYSHFRFILANCPQLETFEVGELLNWELGLADVKEPVVLPSLRHLDVGGVTDDDNHFILSGMILPSLRTWYTYTRAPQCVQLMIERSSCSLENLYMYDISFDISGTSTSLLKIFEHSPYLEHLLLSFENPCHEEERADSNADEEFNVPKLFTLLSPSSTQSHTPLTRLKTLCLHEHQDFTASYICSILDMVEEMRLNTVVGWVSLLFRRS